MTRTWRIFRCVLVPLTRRHLVMHRAATTVALVAIAAGVASLVASRAIYVAVVDAYDTTATRFAGRAALQVTNGTSGVPESLVEDVRRVAGVRAVVPSLEDFIAIPELPGERLYLYGIDLLADDGAGADGGRAETIVSDPVLFMTQPDSVALTKAFLERHRLALNDRLRVLTPSGVAALTIRAAFDAQRGAASALDGRVAIVDLSVAQALLKREGLVSQLAIEVTDGSDVDAVARAVERVVEGRGVVERPRSRTAGFARLLAGYRQGLFLAAVTAMAVALYFVCNVAAIAVEERRREIALLRLVGLEARGAVALIVLELLALAIVASLAGIPLGLGLARGLAGTVGTSVAALYLDVGVPRPALEAGTICGALGIGVGLPLVAAMGPIMRARRLRPLDAARPRVDVVPGPGRHALGALGSAILLGSASVWWLRGFVPFSTATVGMTTMIGTLLGVAVAVPGVVGWSTTVADRFAARRLGPVAQMASRGLEAERGPVAITCAAVLVGLAGTIAIATWLVSLEKSLHGAIRDRFRQRRFGRERRRRSVLGGSHTRRRVGRGGPRLVPTWSMPTLSGSGRSASMARSSPSSRPTHERTLRDDAHFRWSRAMRRARRVSLHRARGRREPGVRPSARAAGR